MPIQKKTSLPPTTDPVSLPFSKGFVAFAPTHSLRESDVFHEPISVISLFNYPNLGSDFGDTCLRILTLGDDTFGGGWESQSLSVFAYSMSLKSSGELGFLDMMMTIIDPSLNHPS